MSTYFTDPAELLAALEVDTESTAAMQRSAQHFRLKVPKSFVTRMRKGDINDPLLRQVLPLEAELSDQPGYCADPVGDLASVRGPGVLHKYHGRALLIGTGACAVHCRYCFRREFPYVENVAAASDWQPAVAALQADTSIREVILSGGDPLTLPDRTLHSLTDSLHRIKHIERLRIHTRVPIVLTERINDELCRWLSSVQLQKIVVVHVNHANEIDRQVENALTSLRNCRATLLNQSVLLRGVNDTADALTQLSERLFAAGVLPYYLHLLDPVRGAAHFEVQADQAANLIHEVASRLPGYLVPRLVREVPGMPYKLPIS